MLLIAEIIFSTGGKWGNERRPRGLMGANAKIRITADTSVHASNTAASVWGGFGWVTAGKLRKKRHYLKQVFTEKN